MLVTKDKKFYKTFFSLFSMIVLQNVIVLSVNLADNIMVGAYSEVSMSGVAAVNQIQFIFQQLIMGTGDALVVMGSQYWGQKRTEPIKSLGFAAISLGVLFGLVLFILASLVPESIAHIFTPSDAIAAQSVEYIRIIKYTYIIFAITNVLLALLRSVETVKISFYVSIMAFVVNCGINYTLINGHFGFPSMGVTGAAIGTLAARICELCIVLIYVLAVDKKLRVKLSDILKTDFRLAGDYYKNSVFFIVVAGMFGLSTALQTVILGHINDSAIGANSIATTLFQVLKVASVGMASATSIVIGKTIGEGNLKVLKEYVKTLQLMFIGVGLLTSAALFFLRIPVISFYNISPETKRMAEQFILVLCITCIGTAYEMPVITGIIRGGGDSKFVFINDLISIWCIVLPLSYFAAFKWNLEPYIVVLCLNSDQIFKCAAAAIKVNRYNWIKKLTR